MLEPQALPIPSTTLHFLHSPSSWKSIFCLSLSATRQRQRLAMDFSDEEDYVPPAPSPKSNIDFTSTNIMGCDSRSLPRHVFFFEDVPWLGGHHDGYPISPTIDAYAEVRLNGRSRPDLPANERAALWQAALTFGILEAVMEVQIPERFLISFSEEEPSRLLLKGVSDQK